MINKSNSRYPKEERLRQRKEMNRSKLYPKIRFDGRERRTGHKQGGRNRMREKGTGLDSKFYKPLYAAMLMVFLEAFPKCCIIVFNNVLKMLYMLFLR